MKKELNTSIENLDPSTKINYLIATELIKKEGREARFHTLEKKELQLDFYEKPHENLHWL